MRHYRPKYKEHPRNTEQGVLNIGKEQQRKLKQPIITAPTTRREDHKQRRKKRKKTQKLKSRQSQISQIQGHL